MQTIQETKFFTGSATIQGDLWGERARDWADIQEGMGRPLFEDALQKAGVHPGIEHLDVGCGSGMVAQISLKKGANVWGIDATPRFVALAKDRTPGGDFRVGEMEELPYEDRSFDVVTGFNSFQYAANPVRALKEALRVSRHGGTLIIATWGNPEDCEAAAYFRALGTLVPPPPPGAPGPFALSQDGRLEALAIESGLTPVRVEDVECPWTYPDLETALRGLLSPGPAVKAVRNSGVALVREALVKVLAPFRNASGVYRMENTFRYLIARA